MPRRPLNPFAAISAPTTPSAQPSSSEHRDIPRRPSNSRGNKITSFFSTSPKFKAEPLTATSALLAAAQQSPQLSSPSHISSPSLSLPTIFLSTAKADTTNDDEPPTTLFQPPSPAETRRIARQHAQFGPLGHQSHRYSSRHAGGLFPDPINEDPPYYYLITTYISYLILIIFGHIRDFFGKRFREKHYRHLQARNGYAPLNSDFDNFYVRRLQLRINDCFRRPITGVPGRFITLLDRTSNDGNQTFQLTGTTTETLNMSSYNYLGFAQSEGPCADAVEETVKRCGLSLASPRGDSGTSDLHLEAEDLIANFVGKEASM
ncbi:MAG: hypothetical protein Q9177_005723, partial [Variospora cf. flavescens]